MSIWVHLENSFLTYLLQKLADNHASLDDLLCHDQDGLVIELCLVEMVHDHETLPDGLDRHDPVPSNPFHGCVHLEMRDRLDHHVCLCNRDLSHVRVQVLCLDCHLASHVLWRDRGL